MGINEKIRNFISCAGVRISSMPLHFCGLISYLASGDGLLAWIMLKKNMHDYFKICLRSKK